MNFDSPAKRHTRHDKSAASIIAEEIQTAPQEACEHATALLARINSLAATASTAETLELTARLLGELEIVITSLSLERGGFVTSWQPSQSLAREAESSGSDTSISARADATALEARYRGELNSLTKRAAGAILKAAVIQTERCSRRVWRFAPPERAGAKTRKLEADIERVARFPHGILITGETGTGKTVSARQIHAKSARASKPFVELNSAAMPEHLVEAELFGYRKGAFTGADRDHKGMFEEADGGILFLDEVGDIPPVVQNKLLKAIDEKQIKRLGTNHYVRCDVQVIAATSRDLRGMIRRGEFREDLYCRLAVLNIEVAPLRERREDIPALIDHFLREAASAVTSLSGRPEEYRVESGAVEVMCAHDWIGNIRVLRNTLYELTSYVVGGEPVTMERVRTKLAKLSRAQASVKADEGDGTVPAVSSDGESFVTQTVADALRLMAQEGDVLLPLEVCLLRRGETLKQWEVRVKQCGIEATRIASGGLMRDAAERLGLSPGSLKSQLHRVRHTPRNGKRRNERVEL